MVHWFVRCWLATFFFFAWPAWSQGMDAQEREKVWAEARATAQVGPQRIALASQAKLDVPADHVFIPRPHATRVLALAQTRESP